MVAQQWMAFSPSIIGKRDLYFVQFLLIFGFDYRMMRFVNEDFTIRFAVSFRLQVNVRIFLRMPDLRIPS
jgi:hypothetical protein